MKLYVFYLRDRISFVLVAAKSVFAHHVHRKKEKSFA